MFITIDYKMTPEELAQDLWKMSPEEQARFFNQLGRIEDGIRMRLEYVTKEVGLTKDGRRVMALIGEHAYPG